jgi:hypothetical protein
MEKSISDLKKSSESWVKLKEKMDRAYADNSNLTREMINYIFLSDCTVLSEVIPFVPIVPDGSRLEIAVTSPDDEDGYYMASVPALKGCHSQAKTIEELEDRIKEAISAYDPNHFRAT